MGKLARIARIIGLVVSVYALWQALQKAYVSTSHYTEIKMETELEPVPNSSAVPQALEAPHADGTAPLSWHSVRWWQVAIFIASILAGLFWTLSAWDQWQMLAQTRVESNPTPAQEYAMAVLSQRSALFNLVAASFSALTAFLLFAQQIFEEGITWPRQR